MSNSLHDGLKLWRFGSPDKPQPELGLPVYFFGSDEVVEAKRGTFPLFDGSDHRIPFEPVEVEVPLSVKTFLLAHQSFFQFDNDVLVLEEES